MTNKSFISLKLILLGTVLGVFFASCSNKTTFSLEDSDFLKDKTAQRAAIKPWNSKSLKKIVLLLGKDYAQNETLIKPLITEYGLASEGGFVSLMRYPEDFKIDGIVRISHLAQVIEEINADMLVSIGIPEGSVAALTKARNFKPSLQIVTLLPCENSIAIEAVSDLVLDSRVSNEVLAAEEAFICSDQDLSILLLASVLAFENSEASIATKKFNADLLRVSLTLAQKKAKSTACQGMLFEAYIDPETSLKSRNHTVFFISSQRS